MVVTRAADQAEGMVEDLTERGALPLLVPCIATVAVESQDLLDAVMHIARYDWIVLTSTNAVRFLFDRLPVAKLSPHTRIAVVGAATAVAVEAAGAQVHAMPAEFTGTAMAAAMGDLARKRVFLPRSRRGRQATVQALRDQGAHVDDVATYDTVSIPPTPAMLAEIQAGVHAVTFTSPSTVDGFFAGDEPANLDDVVIAAIGPTTAQALAERGLVVHVQPEEYTTRALVDALEAYFASRYAPQ